jgi:hypothetical protein
VATSNPAAASSLFNTPGFGSLNSGSLFNGRRRLQQGAASSASASTGAVHLMACSSRTHLPCS